MTQIEYALNGYITEEMKTVSSKEQCSPEFIMQGLVDGTIVIPKNKNHDFSAEGIGKGLSTKVNANIGTSPDSNNMEKEKEKLKTAIKYGVHSIMDLSTGGDLHGLRNMIMENSSVMVGTVPLYAVIAQNVRNGKSISDISSESFLEAIKRQAEEGIDFITIHSGVCRELLENYETSDRVAGVVSRGGSLTFRWMKETGRENPYYEYFDRILDIACKYDMTLSLGDGLRPGGLPDASDGLQIAELAVLGRLVKRCRERKVQVMVEGPGHVPMQDIEMNIKVQKKLCDNAPFYVLGPLVCDCAPGYDHITSAIGGAIAASHGADFLCYVTPSEHLSLPDVDDVKQGVIASRIAAHAADIAKNVPGAYKRNHEMSAARKNLDWEMMFSLSIDEQTARKRREESESSSKDHCSMCGPLCAIKQL